MFCGRLRERREECPVIEVLLGRCPWFYFFSSMTIKPPSSRSWGSRFF